MTFKPELLKRLLVFLTLFTFSTHLLAASESSSSDSDASGEEGVNPQGTSRKRSSRKYSSDEPEEKRTCWNEPSSSSSETGDLVARSRAVVVASRAGNLEALQRLIGEGVNVNFVLQRPSSRITPLAYAVFYNHIPMVQALVSAGVALHEEIQFPPAEALWDDTIMVLEIALRRGHIEIVELLLNAGDIWRDEQNSEVSALPKIIEEIISEERDPRNHERLAQLYKVFERLIEVERRALLTTTPYSSSSDRASPLSGLSFALLFSISCMEQYNSVNFEIVRRLVEAGADINAQSEGGFFRNLGPESALLNAARLYLNLDANLDAVQDPIASAERILEYLIFNGAKDNAIDSEGRNALAIVSRRLDILRGILDSPFLFRYRENVQRDLDSECKRNERLAGLLENLQRQSSTLFALLNPLLASVIFMTNSRLN